VRVLVTGAGGFIGSHLTESLVRAGHEVRAFVRYTSHGGNGWLDQLDTQAAGAFEIVRGDIRDAATVRRAAQGCARIYHLAALIGIPYSYESPEAYVQTNIVGTTNVLDAARELGDGLERMVHTSTSECYGTAVAVPIAEGHPLQAQSPYAATKIAADKLAESYHRSFGLRVVTVRPFNIYGPRQSTRAIIPTIVTQCLTRDIVKLGNTKTTRDLNYVADSVRAFVLAGEQSKAEGLVINVGTGTEVSIETLFQTVCEVTGRTPRLVTDDTRIRRAGSEVERLVADASVARDVLGWAPKYTLVDGLRETIAWLAQHLPLFRPDVYHV
jgi:NAD dependent epimerase/dehydratase